MTDELGFLEDLRWALLMAKVGGYIVAYPDAFYSATEEDFLRAYRAPEPQKTEGEA